MAMGAGKETNMSNTWNKLTPEEARVIVNKGTERPFVGEYVKTRDLGTYVCRRCGAALYRSEDKFDSDCGWPSFDAEVPGAVLRKTDADGQRTEILCTHCGGHLGHVFLGEKLTPKDTRHCVNSLSMRLVPLADSANKFERAVFAGGCFWGVEYFLQQAKGVIRTMVGYTGGKTERPTYEQVCSHTTGHAEAVEVYFDPLATTFEAVAKVFFETHDPSQVNGQGPDIGDQYRSEIFYTSTAQKETAEKLFKELQGKGIKVATRLGPATTFWPAEAYHRDYYKKSGKTPYCHRYVPRFK
jgi:peptide methionine sulfoxide reductase msrA/msrB